MASLIRSGTPILRALQIVQEATSSANFKIILGELHEDVKNGKSFSAALSHYPLIFSPLYLALVSAGELGGTLDQTLTRIAEHRRKQEEIVSRVRSAMIYPALMAFVGAGTIIFMLTFVMPRLMGIFARLGSELPMPTQILIGISTFLREHWWIALIFITVVAVVARIGQKNYTQKVILSRLKLGLPVFGPLTLKSEIAQFSRTMELLLKSGIPVLKALESATAVLGNEVLKIELTKCLDNLREGGSIGRSLKESNVFPLAMAHLITVGEESGKMDEALAEIATFYERDTDEAVRTMTSLMEPVMMLAMGLIVGFIVIAMLLPMFELNLAVS